MAMLTAVMFMVVMAGVMNVAMVIVMVANSPDRRAFVEITIAGAGVEADFRPMGVAGCDAPAALPDRPVEVEMVI